MAQNQLNGKIDDLLRREEWERARRLLEREREKDPQNHWVLTQLAATFYEQRHYKEALSLLTASLRIVPDCPLTLWHQAGTFDALGKHARAVKIYTWLLDSDKSADEDPCWESREWTEALKTDCLYRRAVCLQHLGKKRKAEQGYREYLDRLAMGMAGSYAIGAVKRRLRAIRDDTALAGVRRRASQP